MTQPLSQPVFVILCDDEGAGRIAVEVEAFARYSAHLDAALAELEAKWAHLAPRRRRPPRPDQAQEDQAQEIE